MRLRPHHLLCLLGFRGLGYSPEFVQNLTAVSQALRLAPGTPVTLAGSADCICRACPHLAPDRTDCAKSAQPGGRDRAVLERLGAAEGDRDTWAAWQRRVATAFDAGAQAQVCAGCRWLPLGYCLEGLVSLRGQRAGVDCDEA